VRQGFSIITEDGIKYHLKKLQDKKMLQRIGSTKAGSWKVFSVLEGMQVTKNSTKE
jgi:predicted HTH transcriptional regulator